MIEPSSISQDQQLETDSILSLPSWKQTPPDTPEGNWDQIPLQDMEVPMPTKLTFVFTQQYDIASNALYLEGETEEKLPADRRGLTRFYLFTWDWEDYWRKKAEVCKASLKDIEKLELKKLAVEAQTLGKRNWELEERLIIVRGYQSKKC